MEVLTSGGNTSGGRWFQSETVLGRKEFACLLFLITFTDKV
jgi:hypothetical protein